MAKTLENRVEELEKLVKHLQGKVAVNISKKLGIGDTFDLSGLKWTILDITEKGYVCMAEFLPDKMTFGSNNDWKESRIRKYLNGEFLEKLAAEVGQDNILEFERDLFSLDGQTEYGTCTDKVSIISLDEYRKYRRYLPNGEKFFWTLTPDSTKCNGDERWLRVVSPSGFISGGRCDDDGGVRPFCIFSSSIFESEE